jgi:hypothetical protein
MVVNDETGDLWFSVDGAVVFRHGQRIVFVGSDR